MWRRTEFIDAMKNSIKKHGYKILSCDDCYRMRLKWEMQELDYEYKIWDMLVGQGLYEEFGNIPYRNQKELVNAKDKVVIFLSGLAISDEIQQEITFFMNEALLDERPDWRECEQLRNLIAYTNKQLYLNEKARERCLSVKSSEDEFNIANPYDIDKIHVSAQYQGEIPNLKYFPNLESLGIFSNMSETEIYQLPLRRLRSLNLIGGNCHKIELESDTLKEFSISLGFDWRDEDAQEQVLIDISGLPNLEKLEIRYAGNLTIKCDTQLKHLVSVKITYSRFTDIHWLEHMRNLSTLTLAETGIYESIIHEIKGFSIPTINIDNRFEGKTYLDWEIKNTAYRVMCSMTQKMRNLENEPSLIQDIYKRNTYEENFLRLFVQALKEVYKSIDSSAFNKGKSNGDKRKEFREYVERELPFIDFNDLAG